MRSSAASRWIESVWYSNDSRAGIFLAPLGWLFGVLVGCRRALFRAGLLPSSAGPVPVVVVGNLTAGGSGKTPLVDWLAGQLGGRGHRPGIALRGYGGDRHELPRLVTANDDAAVVGDEAVLHARRSRALVCVCHRRVRAVERLAKAGATVVISDDGLQHYQMERAVEIAVVDGERRFGNGRLLPAGPLRETLTRLDSVDLIVVNGPSGDASELRFELQGQRLVSLSDAQTVELSALAGTEVWMLAGIGHPERFEATLHHAGLRPHKVQVADHGRIELDTLQRENAWPIIMTEKDAVKYRGQAVADAWYLPVEVVMSEDTAEQIVTRVLAAISEQVPG